MSLDIFYVEDCNCHQQHGYIWHCHTVLFHIYIVDHPEQVCFNPARIWLVNQLKFSWNNRHWWMFVLASRTCYCYERKEIRLRQSYLYSVLTWGASSLWSSFQYCPMWNSDEMTIGKTHPTLTLNKRASLLSVMIFIVRVQCSQAHHKNVLKLIVF